MKILVYGRNQKPLPEYFRLHHRSWRMGIRPVWFLFFWVRRNIGTLRDPKPTNMKKTIFLLALAFALSPATQAGLLYVANTFPWAVTPPPRSLGDMPELPASSIRLRTSAAGIFPVHTAAKTQKLGFWNRLTLRMVPKKHRAQLYFAMQDTTDADKKAKNSVIIGAIALAFAIVPWYTIFAAIPLGIIAISMGSRARKMGSTKMTGKGFGIAALALVALWFIITAVYVAAWGGW
jgi:hypothetical protein